MKYLKTFEQHDNDYGRFNDEKTGWLTEPDENKLLDDECGEDGCVDEDEDDEDDEKKEKVWNDDEEIVEKKAMNAGFKAYLDKQKAKKGDKPSKDDKKDDKKGDKPSKGDKKGDKKGLTAGQKKLPEAMQKAILKKQNKK